MDNKTFVPGMKYGSTLVNPWNGQTFARISASLEDRPLFDENGNKYRDQSIAYIVYDLDGHEICWGWADPGLYAKRPSMLTPERLLKRAVHVALANRLTPLDNDLTAYSLQREYEIYQITDASGGQSYLIYGWSDHEAVIDGCDACLWYRIYESDMETETDGGEMDYDSMNGTRYLSLKDAMPDMIPYAYGLDIFENWTPEQTGHIVKYRPDLTMEDFRE